jgi:hypothetical protein
MIVETPRQIGASPTIQSGYARPDLHYTEPAFMNCLLLIQNVIFRQI